MLGFIYLKLKSLVFFIISIVKKSLCCFRRRKKSDAESVPLTAVGVVPIYPSINKDERMVRWDEWGTAMGVTVQDRIVEYRQQQVKHDPVEEPPAPDYFQDMVPEIKRPPKVYVKQKNHEESSSVNRLSFVQDNTMPSDGGELSSWEERSKESTAWAEADGWDNLLREKRRTERQARRTAPTTS